MIIMTLIMITHERKYLQLPAIVYEYHIGI